jgi:hypothetical protein
MVLAGRRAVVGTWPAKGWTNAFVISGIVWLSVTGVPEFNRLVMDHPFPYPFDKLDAQLPAVERPAIVLFRYDGNFGKWPVYNVDAINPDDSPVIRANDLGDRNPELYRYYYAARQPGRVVYRYDLGTDQLDRLGTVKELAGR